VKNKGLKIAKSTSAGRLVCGALLTLLMPKRLRGLRLTVNIIWSSVEINVNENLFVCELVACYKPTTTSAATNRSSSTVRQNVERAR